MRNKRGIQDQQDGTRGGRCCGKPVPGFYIDPGNHRVSARGAAWILGIWTQSSMALGASVKVLGTMMGSAGMYNVSRKL